MARRKVLLRRAPGGDSSKPPVSGVKPGNGRTEHKLNDVDREIIGALTDLRDTLRTHGTAVGSKYTIREVGAVDPPPQLGPGDVRKTREVLGVSQPVFAAIL